jgi:DNA-binding NarL/FixJ family response regulator
MPLASGLDAAYRLRAGGVPSKIVFLTMHDDPQLAAEAFRAGAAGFLPKNSAGEELIAAIQEVIRGNSYLSPLITRDVMSALTTSTSALPAAPVALRPRQIEVLRLVAQGRRMKEIGAILGLSARTVESHKYEMMQSLGVTSNAELVRHAIRIGLLADSP